MSEKCPLDMRSSQYGKSFLIALAINLLVLGGLSLLGSDIFTTPPPTKEKMIAIDMSRYEVQGNDASKPKSAPASGPAGGGKSAAKSDVKTASTPYLGGVESAEVGVNGAIGQGNVGGLEAGAEGAPGDPGGSEDGFGGGGGANGDGEGGGHGYVDLAGYMARLESMKSIPAQALQRHLRGNVGFNVTFNADGDIVGIDMVQSSGHGVLDRAARRLIENGGRIVNTTGQSTTEYVEIRYQ